eukprot:PITA_28854
MFQRAILSIFVDLINEGLEVYMDDFTPCGDDFDQALRTLENVLEQCIPTRLCLSKVKFHMMMTKGVILNISAVGIQADPAKIQEFNITIKDRLRKENLVAYFLSRIPKVNDPLAVDDQFLDEHLFVVTVKMPWYVDLANYLVVGKLSKHLTTRERKLIVEPSAWFSWIGGYLFHTGADMCICRCIHEDEIHDILKAFHDKPYGGHFID